MSQPESVADIPRSCCCHWRFDWDIVRWVLVTRKDGCPWHTKAGVK